MIETGATNSSIPERTHRQTKHKKFISKNHQKLILADGHSPLDVIGKLELDIKLRSTVTTIQAVVVKHLSVECLLGTDYINKYKMNIDAVIDPVRLINSVIISPYEEYSLNVSAGISKATVIFESSFNLKQQIPLLMANALINVHHHTITIPLYNPSPYPQYLSKEIILETFRLSTDDPDFSTTPKPFDNSKSTVATTTLVHTIKTKDNQSPPFDKQYSYYGEKKTALEKIINKLLAAGQIGEAHSQYKSPAFLVGKPSGGHRLVMNYKRLNDITIKDGFDLPNMEETIQQLGHGKNHYFSKLDLKSGFWQFSIDKKDRHKTAFSAFGKLYQWNVLRQGLKHTPSSFQRIMPQSSDGIQPLNEKVQAILNLAEPKALKQANEFVGNDSKPISLTTDFSIIGISGVLQQENEGHTRHLHYDS
ncbi:unnamed protein product [Didymodactylos carnosus]|uniref:Reverse transcriptase domain-containing protein n=1 Tax=Didymodactylos carnosus TaxID=1234261 RepID=A0A814Z1Q0_9BILA|nr:unnamed protein product [Didymodactylos carnosus]CAF1431759.1 unnamed protein product [Didymodactylos carnosus]CAF3999978.1 unnamed protein product [Didymodactylos carnosus]CAF4229709.1 unnamed protein product [Didymodactylos carnosus]